jgi:hypothetical protein
MTPAARPDPALCFGCHWYLKGQPNGGSGWGCRMAGTFNSSSAPALISSTFDHRAEHSPHLGLGFLDPRLQR